MSSSILGSSNYTGVGAPVTSAAAYPSATHTPTHSRMSWGAVFAGAAVAVATTLLLSLLGAALGAGSIRPGDATSADLASYGQGAGLWQIINYVLSMLLGGYVASRLCGTHSHLDGELHGLTTWAVSLLFGTWLLAQAVSGVVGLAGQGVGAAASRLADTAGSVGTAVVPNVDGTALVNRLRRGLSTGGDPTSMTHEQIEAEIAGLVGNGVFNTMSDADHDRLIALVAAEGGLTKEEAARRVARMEGEAKVQIATAEAKARSAADSVAHATAVASRALFSALSLGLLGSLVGAWIGTRHKRALHPVVEHHEPVVHHETTRTVYETTHPVAAQTVMTTTPVVRDTVVRPASVTVYSEDSEVITRYLGGLTYPITKADLLRMARAGNVSGGLLRAIEEMADGTFNSAAEIMRMLGISR